ncbi:hypothetical protein FRX31_026132 [Thalictrum thalictroides]|uniref:Uncharacterized protein n=1 Tax=Thalictrum thalictroides TaxID=46969 RepID=A0A7J6VHS1_THATH|nr:hypothetical protein FRX31_026132 [Thalictrum thalictroides]
MDSVGVLVVLFAWKIFSTWTGAALLQISKLLSCIPCPMSGILVNEETSLVLFVVLNLKLVLVRVMA